MNIRNNSIYLSDKAMFYARLLSKALLQGKGSEDQFVDAELIDRWEKEFPDLVLAYERNSELKQQNKKQYEAAEKDILAKLAPNPLEFKGKCARCGKEFSCMGLVAQKFNSGMAPACGKCFDALYPPQPEPVSRFDNAQRSQ